MESLDVGYDLVVYVPEALLKIMLDLLLPLDFVCLFAGRFAPLLEEGIREVFEEKLEGTLLWKAVQSDVSRRCAALRFYFNVYSIE